MRNIDHNRHGFSDVTQQHMCAAPSVRVYAFEVIGSVHVKVFSGDDSWFSDEIVRMSDGHAEWCMENLGYTPKVEKEFVRQIDETKVPEKLYYYDFLTEEDLSSTS